MAGENGGGRERIAPVIPLFGAGAPAAPEPPGTATWHTTWDADDEDDDYGAQAGDEIDECLRIELENAERNLLRKLRTRQLSMSEARAVVAERDLEPHDIDGLLHAFARRGYLDDRALAEQLVRSAVECKGQGRKVIAQTLAKRGIPRDVTDAVVAELPDDDAERALAFAREKARTMRGLEREVALRRLTGQLARRGYPGAVALAAAREALDEATAPG